MAKHKPKRRRTTLDPKDVVEIHVPESQYDKFKAFMDHDKTVFDTVFLEAIFPVEQRFGLSHIKLVKKVGGAAITTPTESYRKTCSSS